MQQHNLQPGSGASHGSSSVGLIPKHLLCQGPLSPEQLADALDEPHTRRAWWLDLHTGCDLNTGTSIDQAIKAVDKVLGAVSSPGSQGEPAKAPISICSPEWMAMMQAAERANPERFRAVTEQLLSGAVIDMEAL